MISNLARIVTEFFIRYDVVDKNDQDVYQYGNEIVISTLIDFFILFLLAFLFHDFITVFSFWLVFFVLRKFGGGYHADTYLKCKIVFSINIFAVLILVNYFNYIYNIYLFALLTLFSCSLIFLLSPIKNENKLLSQKEIKCNSVKCKCISVLISILTIVLFKKYSEISFTLILAHFSVAFAMLFEYFRRNKKRLRRS